MIAQSRELPEGKAEQIVKDYLWEGLSVHLLHMRHYPVSRVQIAKLLNDRGVMREKSQKRDPSPEEIAERARAVRAEWSEEETRKRWVGSAAGSFQSSLVGRG